MALAAEKTGPAPQPPSFPEQQLQVALITPLIHVGTQVALENTIQTRVSPSVRR